MGALIDTMSQMSSENQMFFFAFSHLLGSTIRTSIYSQLIKKTNYLRSIFFWVQNGKLLHECEREECLKLVHLDEFFIFVLGVFYVHGKRIELNFTIQSI